MRNLALSVMLVSLIATGSVRLLAASPLQDRGRDLEITVQLDEHELAALTRDPWHAPAGDGWMLAGDDGQPLLPARALNVNLPAGMSVVSVDVVSVESVEMAAAGRPLVEAIAGESAAPSLPAVIPDEIAVRGEGGIMAGENVGSVIFHAVQYRSGPHELVIHPRARLRIRLASSDAAGARERAAVPLRSRAETGGYRGPEGAGEFFYLRPGDYPTLDGSAVEYVIITNREMECDFQRLADWRTQCGHPSVVRRIDWIESRYPGGIDRAERIRMFIRDAYEQWGVRWVLLGGDTDVIPARQAHIMYYILPSGEDIAAELYYACLDGSWDGDGDGIYGEGWHSSGAAGDSVDLYNDVYVGRAPCETAAEARAFVDKTVGYQSSAQDGYGRALLASEVVFPFDWDGNPDSIQLNGESIASRAGDEIRGAFSARYMSQYTESPALDADILTEDSLMTALNDGYGMVTLVDHGDAFKCRVTSNHYIRIDDLAGLTNRCYSIFAYVNCSTSQIDVECVNEALILNPNGGAVAAIAPTRLAFPLRSQLYVEQFYREFFQRDATTLGEIYANSLLPFVGASGRDDGAQRWTHLSLSLLGDPLLPVWKQVPTTETATHPAQISLGDTTFTVNVTSGGSPVEGAMVTMVKRTGEYARGTTGPSGGVTLPFSAGSRGPVYLTVTHPVHTPYVDTLQVVPSRAVPFVSTFTVDDDSSGSSSGNGDGRADAGERVELGVTLYNNSGAALTNVSAALETAGGSSLIVLADSLGATILGGAEVYGDIPAGTGTTRTFVVQIAPGVPDGYGAIFGVAVTAGSGAWHDGFRLPITAPIVDLHYQVVDDSSGIGDGDGIPEAGETVRLIPRVLNRGGGTAVNLTAKLHAVVGATVTDSTDTFGSVPPGSVRQGSGGFLTTLSSPSAHFSLDLADAAGHLSTRTITLEPPAAVTGVTEVASLSAAVSGLDLRWDVSPAADLAGYLVYRSTSPTAAPALVTPRLLGPSAYYHDATAAARTTYYYRIAAVDSSGTRGPLSAPSAIVARAIERNGWPAVAGDVFWSSPLIVDLHEDAGGDQEVSCGAKDFATHLWNPDGSSMPGWPLYSTNEIWSSPAAADLNGDGQREIVIGSNAGYVFCWKPSGIGLLQANGVFTHPTGEIRSTPAVDDVDRDGRLDVFVGSYNKSLYAWKSDGTGLLAPDGVFKFINNGQIASSPALANVDADPQLEIFIGSLGGKMWAFNHDGTPLIASATPGQFAVVPGGVWSSPSIGDLDRDGDEEIVCAGLNGVVYVWDGNGVLQPGWPDTTGAGIYGSVALGNIDGDPQLELVVGSLDHKVYAWNPNGTTVTGWPKTTDFEVWGSPILVDVDNDNQAEVVAGSVDGLVYAWNGDGTPVPGWPLTTGDNVYDCPAAGDLDGDGLLEIAVGSYDGMMHVWNLGVPVHPAANPWPMFRHDASRSGWYAHAQADPLAGPPGETGPGLAGGISLNQNSPNPFNPDTHIRFGLGSAGPVNLIVYDVGGRRVKTLVSGRMESGSHIVGWDGKDDQGADVAAGIYFARLRADGRRIDRKMVLLR